MIFKFNRVSLILFCRFKSRRGNYANTTTYFNEPVESPDHKLLNNNEFAKNNKKSSRFNPIFDNVTDISTAFADRLFEPLKEEDKRFSGYIMAARKVVELDGQIILEGKRLIRDALLAGGQMRQLYFTQRKCLEDIPHVCPQAEIYYIPYRKLSRWSSLTTHPGLLGIFDMPNHEVLTQKRDGSHLPITLILDNIRDPGNLGSILRTAAAFNIDQVLLTKGCVDMWNSKVVQGGMGAHYHIPIIHKIPWSSLDSHLSRSTVVHIAENLRHSSTSTPQLENNPCPYFQIDVPGAKQPVALVIGGESEGVSAEAAALCEATYGRRLFVPIHPTVDSLNCGTAAGILLADIQRQFILYDLQNSATLANSCT